MKVLITGSRFWTNEESIERCLYFIGHLSKGKPIIIHGGAEGADSIAGKFSETMGFEVRCYPADWNKYGKAAGMIRNEEMLNKEKPDFIVAFPGIDSAGTRHMVNLARKLGYKVFLGDPSSLIPSWWTIK